MWLSYLWRCGEPKLTERTRGVVRDTTLITDGRGWKKLTALKFITQCQLVCLVKVGCRQVKALVSEEEGKVMEIGVLVYAAEKIICAFVHSVVISRYCNKQCES